MRFVSKKRAIAVRLMGGVGVLSAGLVLAVQAPPATAWAQGAAKPKTSAPILDVEGLKKDLQSRQEARVLGALNTIKAAPTQGKPLTQEVETVLQKGSTIKVTLAALRALGALGSESSSAVVAPYVQHRSATVRRTATSALLQTKGPVAVTWLRKALRSPDAQVRAIAARGLGDLDAKAALGDLFQALDRRVFDAAVSIGKLCDVPSCMQFVGRLGALQLEVITSGTDEILFRPAAQVDDKTKMAVIERLAALRTRSGTEYLADVYRRWPQTGSAMVKEALKDAVEDNGGDLGEDKK